MKNNRVICEICHREFSQITPQHVRFKHSMSLSDYQKQFPFAKIISEATRGKIALSNRNNDRIGFKAGHKVNQDKKPWNKGKTLTEDFRIEIGAVKRRGRITSEKTKNLLSAQKIEGYKDGTIAKPQGTLNGMYGKKISEAHKQALWAGWNRKMNKPETKMNEILSHFHGFRYTGNGKFWLKTPNGKSKNPDFVDIDNRLIVEVFGRYWHSPNEEPEIIELYRQMGWRCLVIWEDDFSKKRVIDSLERFLGIQEDIDPLGISVFDYN